MKINTFLLLILIGIVGYGVWNQSGITLPKMEEHSPSTPAPTKRESASVSVIPKPEHSASVRTSWKRSELMIIHGRIIKESPNCVVVVCEPHDDGGFGKLAQKKVWSHGQWTEQGNLMSGVALADGAIKAELQHYGPLMLFEGGSWGTASSGGAKLAQGTVSIYGPLPTPPPAHSDAINVVGAPLGDPASRLPQNAFTTQFQLEAEKSTSWLWKSNGNPLDRRAY